MILIGNNVTSAYRYRLAQEYRNNEDEEQKYEHQSPNTQADMQVKCRFSPVVEREDKACKKACYDDRYILVD
jgi:hypothetical protein